MNTNNNNKNTSQDNCVNNNMNNYCGNNSMNCSNVKYITNYYCCNCSNNWRNTNSNNSNTNSNNSNSSNSKSNNSNSKSNNQPLKKARNPSKSFWARPLLATVEWSKSLLKKSSPRPRSFGNLIDKGVNWRGFSCAVQPIFHHFGQLLKQRVKVFVLLAYIHSRA